MLNRFQHATAIIPDGHRVGQTDDRFGRRDVVYACALILASMLMVTTGCGAHAGDGSAASRGILDAEREPHYVAEASGRDTAPRNLEAPPTAAASPTRAIADSYGSPSAAATPSTPTVIAETIESDADANALAAVNTALDSARDPQLAQDLGGASANAPQDADTAGGSAGALASSRDGHSLDPSVYDASFALPELAGPVVGGSPQPPAQAPADAPVWRMSGVTHTWQKWNNCGPSAVHMALSLFGVHDDQLDIAAVLKPVREDTNVNPEELAAYVRARGLKAVVRIGGTAGLARALVRAGAPVIAEQWIDVDGRGEMGHYRVVTGYDDHASELIAQDSYYGADRRYSHAAFEVMWRPFGGAYVAVYHPEHEAAVSAALGADVDGSANLRRVLAAAEIAALAAPADPWSHFVLGEMQSRSGDMEGSVEAFTLALSIGLPFRAFWYQFGFARSLFAIGAYDRLIQHADATLAHMQGDNLEEWRYWRGRALRALGNEEAARRDFEMALRFHPGFTAAREALAVSGADAP